METNEDDTAEKIPITAENLHELVASIPKEQFDNDRAKLDKLMAESHKFWAEREKESRKNKDTSD